MSNKKMLNKNSIYASYGIIMKELQNTELLFTQMIYSINLKRRRIKSAEKVKKIYTNCLSETFSQLVKMLKDLSPESDLLLGLEVFKQIENIVKLRNYYAHSFFKEFTTFENQKLIEDIYEKNKFAFHSIKKFNISLQNRLKVFLRTLKFKTNESEDFAIITSEDWESTIDHLY